MSQPPHSAKPSVLFVYYSYTKKTLKVVETMADVLRGRGCDVQLAAIGFTDPRYAGRFTEFPMPHPFRELIGMIPAESPRRRPAKIVIPDVVTERDYDLVCIGSPTWWLSTDVPVRSFLQSDTASRVLAGKPFAVAVCCRRYWKHNLKTVRRLGTARGGGFADGIGFRYQGGQVRSLLSLLSYLGSGEYRKCPRKCPKVRASGRRHGSLPLGRSPAVPALAVPACRGVPAQEKGRGLVLRDIKERAARLLRLRPNWPRSSVGSGPSRQPPGLTSSTGS